MYAAPSRRCWPAVSFPSHRPKESSNDPGKPNDGVHTVLKKLWFAPNAVIVCLGVGSPGTR